MKVNICNYTMTALAFFFVSANFACGATTQREGTPFRTLLMALGDKTDCFFTVESVGVPGRLGNTILNSYVEADVQQIHTVSDVLQLLTNRVELMSLVNGQTNILSVAADRSEINGKTVVSIRDSRVCTIDGYSLSSQMTVAYNGNASGLVEYLHGLNKLIDRPAMFEVRASGCFDFDGITPVYVNATNQIARAVLTDFIHIDGYNRIIWSSYTDGNSRLPVVTVVYHGRRIGNERNK